MASENIAVNAKRFHNAWAMLFLVVGWPQTLLAEETWPKWRGPRADGHSSDPTAPIQWDTSLIAWKTALPGRGQSSPIIAGDRIFLTTALDKGQQRMVLCVDRRDGKVAWQQVVPWKGEPEKIHKMNSWASASCATDGERVVAFFGRGGLHCYGVDGQHQWSQDLGPFDQNPWGTAACPVIVGELVIQNCDNDVGACLIAFDKRTGKQVWRTERPAHRGWSTPVLLETETRTELLLNGDTGVTAYNPANGGQLWFCKSFNGRGEPTVTPGRELVYLVNGKAGDVYAVKPGGDGDVTSTHMAWHTPRRSGRDLPSPILVDNYLIVVSMSGIASCYDAQSGAVLWTQRLGGNYSASPIALRGVALFVSEEGKTLAIEPGPQPKILAESSVAPADDEIFRASLAVAGGQVFLRSDQVLYCIGKPAANAAGQ
jgi:outer membrane protein assembly factor BamB